MDASKFTTRSQEAINTAISTSASAGHAQVEAVHLLAALLAQPEGIARPLFEAAGVQPAQVVAGVEAELKRLPAASGSTVGAPSYSRAALSILSRAGDVAAEMKDDYVPDDVRQARLEETLSTIVSPPFRVRQIEEWMHVRGASSFDVMTNVPKDVRAELARHYSLALPEVIERTPPASDGSEKYLFKLPDGNRIESVYMPMGDRTSICLSSQAGCAVGCTFCVTGFFGAGRNLTPSEMLGQFFERSAAIRAAMEPG